jgi:anti-sigma factor RsiW
MNPCPFAPKLKAWLAEQLSAAEALTVEAHVEGCPTCQQSLEKLTGTSNILHAAPGEEWTSGQRRQAAADQDFLRQLE